MRAWAAELSEAEVHEEETRVRRGSEPDAQKAHASESIRRRAAKWGGGPLASGVGAGDAPLLDGHAVGAAVPEFWGGIFGHDQAWKESEAESWFLDMVPHLSRAVSWRVDREVVRAAVRRTGRSATGPDGLLYSLLRGADWLADAI